MKLSEIRSALEKHNNIVKAGPMLGEDFSEYSQRCWDSKPRIAFSDLPASLQKTVRNKYTPAILQAFLTECYSTPEFEKRVHAMSAEELAELPSPPEAYISFQTMVSGIDQDILESFLIHTRNTAIYTLEEKGTSPDANQQIITNDDSDIRPALYGNHACEAFEAVLQKYRKVDAELQQNEQQPAIIPIVKQPQDIVAPKDKVTRLIFANNIPYGQAGRIISGDEIPVKDDSGKKTKVAIAPVVALSLLDLPPNVQISRTLSAIDNIVHGCICSLWAAGNKNFTGQAIYSTMTGKPAADVTADWLTVIDESWTRLRTTQVEIDTGTMGNAYNFKRWQRKRAIIQGGEDIITVGNQYGETVTTIYSVSEEPILYSYATTIDQINRYPRILQNTPVNKNPEILVLQNALLSHINAIPRISNHIRYDTLWSILKIEAAPIADEAPEATKKRRAAERKKKAVLRGYIHKMLDYWKEKGFITGWTEETKGKTIQSIVIAKPKKNEALPPAPQKKIAPREKW